MRIGVLCALISGESLGRAVRMHEMLFWRHQEIRSQRRRLTPMLNWLGSRRNRKNNWLPRKADADIARQQREAAELQEYNKPENVQRRKDIEDLKIANQNEATAREEKEANSEASRLDRE